MARTNIRKVKLKNSLKKIDKRKNNGAKKGENRGGGRKAGMPNKVSLREVTNLHEMVKTLTKDTKLQQQPVIVTIERLNYLMRQIEKDDIATLLPILMSAYNDIFSLFHARYGTIEGLPTPIDNSVVNTTNNLQVNYDKLDIDEKRKLLELSYKVESDKESDESYTLPPNLKKITG